MRPLVVIAKVNEETVTLPVVSWIQDQAVYCLYNGRITNAESIDKDYIVELEHKPKPKNHDQKPRSYQGQRNNSPLGGKVKRYQ